MPVIVPNFASSTEDRASGAQVIEGSVKFEGKSRLQRTTSSTDGNQRVYTFSAWYKPAEYDGSRYLFDVKGAGENPIAFDTGRLRHSYNNGSDIWDRTSERFFKDANAWYHVVASVDTTHPTTDDRVKLYVNGQRITDFTGSSRPSQGYQSDTCKASCTNALGWWINGTSRDLKGWMSNVHLIDGSALEPTDFGFQDPLTNTWRPKKFNKDIIPSRKGRVFSSTFTASGNGFGSLPPSLAFNGSLGDGFNNSAGGQWITWDSSSYNLSGNVRMYTKSSSGVYDIYINGNGTKVADTGSSYAWVDCGTHDVINEIQWAGTTYNTNNGLGSAGIYVAAIIVDGVWLRDDLHEYGTHGFFLPLDGNTPIGQDQSGLGNDFQTIWLQGGNTLDKATGAFPILNTVSGGQSAAPGTRGSFADKTVTVASSKFVIDGTSQTPVHLLRGGTYKFDQSDSSNTGHPLRFSTTDNGSHGGGSEYTDGRVTNGTPGSAGAYTTITVPHNAPDKLYYYCTAHSGMGGDVINSTDIRKADPYAWKCVTAVPLAHDFTEVSNRVNCAATEKTTTATNVNRSTNNYHFYHGCTIFNGSSGNGGFKIHNHADMDFGTDNFTLECWFWSESNSTDLRTLFSSSGYKGSGSVDSFNLYLYENGWRFYNRVGGSFTLMSDLSMVYDRFEWNHLAWVREGTGSNQNKLYCNGSKIAEFTNAADYDTGQHIYLGANDYNTNYPEYEHNGFIQDFRMYKGVAKYTSDFIPASPDPGVQKQSPSGIPYKTALKKPTEGAVTFGVSAASHYLTLGGQSDFNFGTGDFCIEGFFYINVLDGAVGHLIDFRPNGTDGLYPLLRHQGSNIQCSLNTSGGNLISVDGVTGQRWVHVAFTRAGTAVKLFVNGKVVGTATSSDNVGVGANRPMIGGSGYHQTSLGHRGNISNVRIIKGSAVYTAEFIPPTEPLKNITNTKLLCCQSNISPTDYAVSPGTITATGAKTKACVFNPFTDDVDSATAKASGVAYLSSTDQYTSNDVTFDEGGLKYSLDATAKQGYSNIWIPLEGKWYWEVTLEVIGTGRTGLKAVDNYEQWNGDNITYLSYDGSIRKGPSDGQTQSGLGNTVNGNTIGFKVDRDNNTVQFVRNGCEIGNPETLTADAYYKATVARNSSSGSTPVGEFNFGQKPFKYPQDGFQPLTLANLPRTEFPRPDQYFKPVQWTGTTAKDIQVDVGFRPDLVICKSKTQNYGWYWYDSVRGGNLGSGTVPVGEKQCYRAISSNMNAAESDETSTQNGIVLNSNGFIVDKDGQAVGEAGQGNLNMIGYCWKAGGFSNTYNIDGVGYSSWSDTGLTAGDITPTGMSLGTKQGFNIIGYTGIGGHPKYLHHHLGAVPGLVIIKNRTYAKNWAVKFPKHMAGGQRLELQDSGGYNSEGGGSGGLWNATNPNATRITFSDYFMTNGSGDAYVAYVWIDVEGLQKFGTYVGNQSTGGPFVHCGFRPELVWIKRAGSGKWNVADSTRNPTEGPHGRDLELNTNNAPESYATDNHVDLVSNGFKIRSGNETEHNGNGETYHFAAWSAQAMNSLYGAQSDAR